MGRSRYAEGFKNQGIVSSASSRELLSHTLTRRRREKGISAGSDLCKEKRPPPVIFTVQTAAAPRRRVCSMAEPFRDAGVTVQREQSLFGIGVQRPAVVFERPPEDDAVSTRKHVERAADVTVIHLGLRQEHFELAAHRNQLVIPE